MYARGLQKPDRRQEVAHRYLSAPKLTAVGRVHVSAHLDSPGPDYLRAAIARETGIKSAPVSRPTLADAAVTWQPRDDNISSICTLRMASVLP